ncbi:hypothetical protein Ccrd_021110 [Cynara cardunculus var. scolymus]|uniref:Uncharacterized protein n=1 Tax=Cynara cardunculus var. scolymus TaxID=59895 RepID=A0A118K0F7_CYNCS|nr:hypothetical protein Ccrd_021110 [Cynara cardunculus var. scolymus]
MIQSSPLATDPSSKLNILGHNRHSLGVNRTKISVLEKPDQISLRGFLERSDGATLKPQIGLEILCDFPNQSLEWKFPDQKLGTLLVSDSKFGI